MSLLILPPELLARVARETMPEGLQNFVLTCKATYFASGCFIELHNTLKRRYNNFSYSIEDDPSGEEYCRSSWQFIARIAEEPLIAQYIVSADFRWEQDLNAGLLTLRFPCEIPGDERETPGGLYEPFFEYIRESPAIRHLLEESSYLRQAAVEPSQLLDYMIAEYKEGVGATISTCILLTLLPNENSPSAILPSNMSSLLNLIPDKANDHRDQSASLSKLMSILPSTNWRSENSPNLHYFTPLLRIRSVRELYFGSCFQLPVEDVGIFNNLKDDGLGLGLEVVELAGCGLELRALYKFLSGMPRLRSLKLSQRLVIQVDDEIWFNWNAEAFMATIQDAVGDRVGELSFSSSDDIDFNEKGITSMKGFAKLKVLELDSADLYTNPYDANRQMDNDPDDGSSCPLNNGAGHQIPRLCNLVPATIETLTFMTKCGGRRFQALEDLFVDIEANIQELPNLREITIRGTLPNGIPHYLPEIWHDLPFDFLEAMTTAGRDLGDDIRYRNWLASLRTLSSSVRIKFIDCLLPAFMEDFSSRFGVGIDN